MIITEKKKNEELLKTLAPYKSVFLVGCGQCATSCATGGEKEVAAIEQLLTGRGITVTGTFTVESPCDVRLDRLLLRDKKTEIEKAAALLVLACGAGVQALREVTDKILVATLDTIFLGTIQRLTKFNKFFPLCGACVLSDTGGYCPRTRCAKGMVSGPCGGAVEGKCEVDRDRDCVWTLIYHYLKSKNLLETLGTNAPVRHSRSSIIVKNVEKNVGDVH